MYVFLWPSESCSFCHDGQRSLERGERCKDPPDWSPLRGGQTLARVAIILIVIWDLHLLKTVTSSSYIKLFVCLVCSSFRNDIQNLWKQVVNSPNHELMFEWFQHWKGRRGKPILHIFPGKNESLRQGRFASNDTNLKLEVLSLEQNGTKWNTAV